MINDVINDVDARLHWATIETTQDPATWLASAKVFVQPSTLTVYDIAGLAGFLHCFQDGDTFRFLYSVRPNVRRMGHGTELLRQAVRRYGPRLDLSLQRYTSSGAACAEAFQAKCAGKATLRS